MGYARDPVERMTLKRPLGMVFLSVSFQLKPFTSMTEGGQIPSEKGAHVTSKYVRINFELIPLFSICFRSYNNMFCRYEGCVLR